MQNHNLHPLNESRPLFHPDVFTIRRVLSDPRETGGALIVAAGLDPIGDADSEYSIIQRCDCVAVTSFLIGRTVILRESAPITEAFAPVQDDEGRECFDITPVVKHREFSPRRFRARMTELMGRREVEDREADAVLDLDDAVRFVDENVGTGDLTYAALDQREDFYETSRDHINAVHLLTLVARA